MDAVTLAAANSASAKSFAYLLPRSNGTDDLAAIQAILDKASAGPIRVQGRHGQTYVLSDALVIRSGTSLDMTGCVINGNAAKNMLKNAAAIPARSVTDAATTAGSATVTSATANFAAGDVGKAVQVVGAGPDFGNGLAPGSLYATITAVNSATSVTVSRNARLTKTGATLNVFPDRDSGISIIGGTWNAGQKDATAQTLNGHTFLLRRVDDLALSGIKLTSTRTGQGGSYGISLADAVRVRANGLTLATGSDGIHTAGPAQYIDIRGVQGTTGDDMVAFTCMDGRTVNGSLLGDTDGDITDVTVRDILPNGSWTALKVTSGTGSENVPRWVRRFTASGIVGSTTAIPVNVIDYAGSGGFEGQIESVDVVTTTGTSSVVISTGTVPAVRIRNITWDGNSPVAPSNGVVSLGSAIGTAYIDGVTVLGGWTGTLNAAITISASVASLLASNLQITASSTGGQTCHGVCIKGAGLTIAHLAVSKVYRLSDGGNLIQIDSTATTLNLGEVEVADGYMVKGSVLNWSPTSTNTTRARISNWRQTGGALVIPGNPCEVNLANVEIAASAGAVRASVTAATPLRVRCSNVAVTSGTLLSRTASQAVSATGLSATADLSMLTPIDQDIVNNTNGALACGTGLAIFHTGGTGNGWKNLYSGTTY